ncbi:chemotaxis protein CheX [Granulosicoccus sp. 3-233]|uniref:chemotaxis protein CheX n=1 Tax=Granulosicoccus sp. 3-233 TaxID=3417969 RepID=UPI003D34B2C5
MTILSEEELNEIVDVVCMTVLDLPVHPGGRSALHSGQYLTASIGISGAWNGVVKVRVSLELLTRAASDIFSIPVDDVDSRDLVDTITELTNMLGGTVKCMLPESCDLALPEILPSEKRTRGQHEWVYFSCESMPLAVAVMESASGVRAA